METIASIWALCSAITVILIVIVGITTTQRNASRQERADEYQNVLRNINHLECELRLWEEWTPEKEIEERRLKDATRYLSDGDAMQAWKEHLGRYQRRSTVNYE